MAPRSARRASSSLARRRSSAASSRRPIKPEIFVSFFAEWPLFLGIVVATLMASSLLGYLISRWKVLPGTTAVWGSTPGAASAMVLMADAFGADARLVAFMQYLRVIFVSMAAALIARLWVDTSGVEPAPDRLVSADRLAGFRRDPRHRRRRALAAGGCCAFPPAPFSGR